MASQQHYALHAFYEVLNLPKYGADWLPKFKFQITASEIVALARTIPAINPSWQITPPVTLEQTCRLVATDLKTRRVDIQNIKKDLYAIFATTGYMATAFNRTIQVVARCAELNKNYNHSITPLDFHAASDRITDNVLEFCVDVGHRLGVTRTANLETKISLSIAVTFPTSTRSGRDRYMGATRAG